MATKEQRKQDVLQASWPVVAKFKQFNPSRQCHIKVEWRGNAYVARCYYYDSFTGGRCTFALVRACQ